MDDMLEGASSFFGFKKPDFEFFDYKPSKYDYDDGLDENAPPTH